MTSGETQRWCGGTKHLVETRRWRTNQRGRQDGKDSPKSRESVGEETQLLRSINEIVQKQIPRSKWKKDSRKRKLCHTGRLEELIYRTNRKEYSPNSLSLWKTPEMAVHAVVTYLIS